MFQALLVSAAFAVLGCDAQMGQWEPQMRTVLTTQPSVALGSCELPGRHSAEDCWEPERLCPPPELLTVTGAPARASPRVEVRDQTGPANIHPQGNHHAGPGFGKGVILTPFLSLFKEKPEEINKYWTRQGTAHCGLGEEQC